MVNENLSHHETEINWFRYVVLILKNKELIIKTVLSVVLLTAGVSLIIPPTYLAQTKILPPQTASSSMAAAFVSQVGGVNPAILGVKTTNDFYMALLDTRDVSEYVARKLDLKNYYELDSNEKVRRELMEDLKLANDRRSGIITIQYFHRDPKMAANIANAFVEGLQELNNNLAVTEAATRRLFFEGQLKLAKENLIRSEEAMKSFQQRTGTIKIDEEAKGVIETVSKMRAKVSSKEVELRVMRAYATPQNPDMLRLQDEVSALRAELSKMESQTQLEDGSVPSVGRISSVGTEYIRRTREFRYNEALYEILMKQFGAAKLDESKDAALVQVVESAEPPETRIKPQRRKMVVRAFFWSLILAVLFVLIRDYLQSVLSTSEVKRRMQEVTPYLGLGQLVKDLKLDKVGAIVKKKKGGGA